MAPKKNPKKSAVPTPPAEEQTPKKSRRPWYIALLAVGAALLGATVAFAILGTFADLEKHAFNIVNHASLPGWVGSQLAKPLSNAVWGMVALVIVLLAFPKFRLIAWQYAVAAGFAYSVVFVLEHLVDRARPLGMASYEVVSRAVQGGPGFPSGHVAVLTALGLTLWPMVSWPWRLFMMVLVGAEAWARIYLGVHAPLDVIGGLAAAMAAVGIIHLTPFKIRKFFRLAA